MPLRQGLYRQASGIRRPAQVTFLCVPGTASLRGASGASEPGIQAWTPRVVLDSGLRPTAGPGMAGEKRLRAVLQFISTASRLRARLLVQSLAQPQGAAAGRIPQSAPQRQSTDPPHEFPRASGLHLGLHQHSRGLGRGRQRFRQTTYSARPPISCRIRTSSWCCSFTPTSSIRTCGLRSAACSGASSSAPHIIRCITRPIPSTSTRTSVLSCAVGLDVRHALCAGEDARAPHLRLPRAAGCAGELVDPFINAAGHIWPKRPADMPALPVAERKPA